MLQIEEKQYDVTTFGALAEGDIFKIAYAGRTDVYRKMPEFKFHNCEVINSYCFIQNNLIHIASEVDVIPLKGKLIISKLT